MNSKYRVKSEKEEVEEEEEKEEKEEEKEEGLPVLGDFPQRVRASYQFVQCLR